MEREVLQSHLASLDIPLEVEEGGEWLNVQVAADAFKPYMRRLREDALLNLDYLFCLTCVDWKSHLTMVYHLTSIANRKIQLVVKVKLDRTDPLVDTVSDIWRTAEFHEREVFEMYGVQFKDHPDLRLLILPDGWEGKHPMRKDFEDPVNMIKL